MKAEKVSDSDSDAWRIIWSEQDDNWISDGGTTYHRSKKEMNEYVNSVLAKNTDAYNLIPLFIDKWVEK